MKQLVEVIKLIADKYTKDTNLIISNNHLTLEYLTLRDGEQDVYKSLTIDEFDHKLKVYIYEDKITKIIDISELEDIIKILDKQSKRHELTNEEIQYIKTKYTFGTKIKLIKMYDLKNAVPPNTIGIINHIDDKGIIHVSWENGCTKGIIFGTDEFIVIDERSNTHAEDNNQANTTNQ